MRLRSLILWLAAAFAAVPLLYGGLALLGAVIPRAVATPPGDEVLIFVSSNGIHADIIMPATTAEMDWVALTPPEDIADPARARGWVAVGWGQRDVYLNVPRWADLTPGIAAKAMIGGESLLHVTHMGPPRVSETVRPVRISRDGYRRMVRAMAASFVRGAGSRTVLIPGSAYGSNDAFYEGRGTYSAIRTCNQWTGERLADAGVKVGSWTPLPQSLMWRFR